MIYKREDYIEETEEGSKFPVKHVEALQPLDGGSTRFVGHVALGIQTPLGVQQLPVSFEIDADSVQEAFSKFDQSAEPRIEETRRAIEDEIQKARQDASSRIVRPGELGMQGRSNILDLGKNRP
jgi:hypothetical protein